MDKISEVLAEKLSVAIEVLELDQRAYHVLKRAGIHHISDIITRGEVSILNLKNMGPVTANRVFSETAKHLDIPVKELFGQKTVQAALSCEERPFDPLESPVTILDLPFSIIKSLHSQGVFLVDDLLRLKAKSGDGYGIGGLHTNAVRRIYSKLNLYFSRFNLCQDVLVNPKQTDAEPEVLISTIDLGVILLDLMRNKRASRIIELRGNLLWTLEEIAKEVGGITRERIRQIINQVHERVWGNLNVLMVICDHFEERARNLSTKPEGKNTTISELARQFKLELPDDFNLLATEKELEMLIAIIRLLVIHEKPWFQELLKKRWENLVDLICFSHPPITKRDKVTKFLKEQKEKNKKVSYKELALLILSKEKRPMHWSEIVERAYRFGSRDAFNSTALYNSLMNHNDLFVRVDAGTYALTEWGLDQVDTYPDIISSILKSSRKPLSVEALYHKVNEIRQVKQSTLLMSLDIHPRFYKSLEKTYGLRIWLPPREKQTLRTPEWLVEDGDSYKRLEHARQRGYDVDSMVRIDLE